MSKINEKKLNKEQLEAVTYKKGPLLIIAGAGTGKTTVITERIKYLIKKNLAKTTEILALTFTEKASREMEERVDIAMPYGYTQMWISTFHSFCDRILRAEALHIGLDPRYKLMTEAETVQLIRSNLFNQPAQAGFELDYFRPLGNPTKFISGMIQHFSRLQDEDISSQDYKEWVEQQRTRLRPAKQDFGEAKEEKAEIEKWEELARAYKKYEELKVKEGAMDFGDLIIKTLQLFRQRPNVLSEYRKQFKYILVDEFQDTNVAQYELLKLLVPPKNNGNLTVVGDDSQSVYKFRGAAISNILNFKKDYKKAKTVVLTKNYRSTQVILDSAYRLIQHNNPDTLESRLGVDKNLVSVKNSKASEPVKFIHKDRIENEAESVAKEIGKLAANSPLHEASAGLALDYKDIAILVRANNHSDAFIRAFQRNGIPYQFLGPGRLFRQPEVIDLISYLKVLYDFTDSVSFYRLLSIDYLDIASRDLIRIGNYAKKYNLSFFEACDPPSHKASEGQEKLDFISPETKEKIYKLVRIINKHFDLVKKETAGQLLYYFLEDTGLLQKLLNPDTAEAEKKALNISKFFDKLKTYETEHEDASVSAVVDWLELASEIGESPLAADSDWTRVNAVNILTVHSAKGLEFPVVFLVNLVSQRFPTVERREQIPIPEELIKEVLPQGDYHTQEERRLFYVGMTRAKELLFLTAADYYGEAKREKKLSPFIFEALGDKAVSAETSKDEGQQLSFLDYSPSVALAKEGKPTTREPLHIDYLSYSQIDTFLICPLHYKLRYIFKIPTPASASLSFGTSIHETIKNFYEALRKEPHFVKTSRGLEDLMLDLLKKNWVKEGFTSKSHEKKFFEKGKLYLAGYLNDGYDPKNIPALLEQRFTLPLPYKEGEKPLKIGGVMDRVDLQTDGYLEIIDYKTGATIPTQPEVDKNLQLTFYGLAATSIREEPFNKQPENINLSLYFLDQQQRVVTKRNQNQLQDAIEEIYKIRREIEGSDFKCSGSILCEKCEYSLFCRGDGQ